jgi:AAA+ ATPase superfamily predicted ATPase
MVFVSLSGGLGNQMFQYACGLSYSKRNNETLILETSELQNDGKREYALGAFNINNTCISSNPHEFSFFKRLTLGIFGNIIDVKEKVEFKFDSDFNRIKGQKRLIGYWQNQKYFEAFKEEILSVFTLSKPGKAYCTLSEKYTSQNTVSIHVRRGDYVSELHTNQVHGTCSLDYYNEAIKRIKEDNPLTEFTFLIFSDDKAWSKDAFSFLENKEIIEQLTDSEELILMSQCKHNVIANSSFSWWAAWLNKNKNKTVIAPQKWFAKDLHDTSELIPEKWIKI